MNYAGSKPSRVSVSAPPHQPHLLAERYAHPGKCLGSFAARCGETLIPRVPRASEGSPSGSTEVGWEIAENLHRVDLTKEQRDAHIRRYAELLEAKELGAEIEQAIGKLRAEYRTAILLRHVEGRAYEEIAEIMDMPLGTVKTHIHRARAELREMLAHLRVEG